MFGNYISKKKRPLNSKDSSTSKWINIVSRNLWYKTNNHKYANKINGVFKSYLLTDVHIPYTWVLDVFEIILAFSKNNSTLVGLNKIQEFFIQLVLIIFSTSLLFAGNMCAALNNVILNLEFIHIKQKKSCWKWILMMCKAINAI